MQSQTVRKSAVVSVNAAEALELPRHFYDASLLFRCMDMFQVDQRELATDDPLLFHELQGRCSLCPHKDDCARDLEQKFDNDRLDKVAGVLPEFGDAYENWRHPKLRTRCAASYDAAGYALV